MPRRSFGSLCLAWLVVAASSSFLVFAELQSHTGVGTTLNLAAHFSSSFGLSVGSSVSLAGVFVGRVTSVQLTRKSLLSSVHFTLSRKYDLPTDSSLAIGSSLSSTSAGIDIHPGSSDKKLRTGNTVTRTLPVSSLEDAIGDYVFGNGGFSDSD